MAGKQGNSNMTAACQTAARHASFGYACRVPNGLGGRAVDPAGAGTGYRRQSTGWHGRGRALQGLVLADRNIAETLIWGKAGSIGTAVSLLNRWPTLDRFSGHCQRWTNRPGNLEKGRLCCKSGGGRSGRRKPPPSCVARFYFRKICGSARYLLPQMISMACKETSALPRYFRSYFRGSALPQASANDFNGLQAHFRTSAFTSAPLPQLLPQRQYVLEAYNLSRQLVRRNDNMSENSDPTRPVL